MDKKALNNAKMFYILNRFIDNMFNMLNIYNILVVKHIQDRQLPRFSRLLTLFKLETVVVLSGYFHFGKNLYLSRTQKSHLLDSSCNWKVAVQRNNSSQLSGLHDTFGCATPSCFTEY